MFKRMQNFKLNRMKELIEQIKLKADSIPTNTKENRRVKGAYVDCLMMVKEASKNLVVGQSEQLKAVQKLKDFAYEVCPLHREDDLEEIVGSL